MPAKIANLESEIERVNRQYNYKFTTEKEMIETILHDYNGIVRSAPIIWTSRETLQRRMKELGVPVPPKGGNRRKIITEKFLSMQTEDMTASEIATIIGCCTPTIYKLAVKHNKTIKYSKK